MVDLPESTGSSTQSYPLAAIFLIAASFDSYEPSLCRVTPAETCIELLRSSFALDPVDRQRASHRLATSGAVANAIPGFRLNYPRVWNRLDEVRHLIEETLRALDSRDHVT